MGGYGQKMPSVAIRRLGGKGGCRRELVIGRVGIMLILVTEGLLLYNGDEQGWRGFFKGQLLVMH